MSFLEYMNYAVDYARTFDPVTVYVATSLTVIYYMYTCIQEANQSFDTLVLDMNRLCTEHDIVKRRLKFYKYCFHTQKKAETVYQQENRSLMKEISTLRRQLENREPLSVSFSDPPSETYEDLPRKGVFTMTLRPRDETGKVKRRKISETDSEYEAKYDEDNSICAGECMCDE